MSHRLIQSILNAYCILDISLYPPVSAKQEEIVDFLHLHGIEYHLMPVFQFYKRFSLEARYSAKKAFQYCSTATCHTLWQGMLAPCIVPFSAEVLNRRFHTEIPISGWIQLYDSELTGWEINRRLKLPFDLCRHCNPVKTWFSWDCGSLPILDDWLVENSENPRKFTHRERKG